MSQPLHFAILLFLGLGLGAGQTAVVCKSVNLRVDPSIRRDPIKKLRPSTQLELLGFGSRGGFYHVRTVDGAEGWVWGRNIEILESADINTTTPTAPTDDRYDHRKTAAKKVTSVSSGTTGLGGGVSAGGGGSRGDGGAGTLPSPLPSPTPVYRVEAGPAPSFPSFPWPPPAASASEAIPNELLVAASALHSLGDVNARLVMALERNGYAEKKYYAVPDGFALATRLEQIEADGRPKPEPDRWSADSPEFRSLGEYLRALFSANPGYYRVIVFIVTDVPFTETGRRVNETEAAGWLEGGLNQLPQEIAGLLYHDGVVSTALIYEFHKDQGKDPQLNEPSRLGAREHLVHSGIWSSLGGGL